jgi:hypothetical protein
MEFRVLLISNCVLHAKKKKKGWETLILTLKGKGKFYVCLI